MTSPKHYTLFISDLHLDEAEPKITEAFKSIIKNVASNADAVYILGDLFEIWPGDETDTALSQTVISQLQQLQQHVPTYFMRGNRDFMIGKKFIQATGITLLDDPTVIDLYGTPTLLTHGDLLCTLDKKYQYFRRIVQHPLIKKLLYCLPLSTRQHLFGKVRRYSEDTNKQRDLTIMDVTESAVIEMMKKYNVKHMIHGHTHRPKIHNVPLPGLPHCDNGGKRIVLGAWHDKPSTLIVTKNNELLLEPTYTS